jgi:hypothetical protein
LGVLTISCTSKDIKPDATAEKSTPMRDINEVLAEHDEQLMAIPGVVGVYVGLLNDTPTHCLKVMVVNKSGDLDAIPESLEGHPIVIVETDVIRPLDDQ